MFANVTTVATVAYNLQKTIPFQLIKANQVKNYSKHFMDEK